jgi:hypothetical protein
VLRIPLPIAPPISVGDAEEHGPVALGSVGKQAILAFRTILQPDHITVVAERAFPPSDEVGQVGVPVAERGRIRRNHDKPAARNRRPVGDGELDPVGEPPPRHVHLRSAAIEEFDPFLQHVDGRRVVHDLVDNDLGPGGD